MSITDIALPAWTRWALYASVFAAGVWCGGRLTANVKNVEVAHAKTATAELRAEVATNGAKSAEHVTAVVVAQNKITQESDHGYQTRRAALVDRMRGGGLRQPAAAAGCSQLPATTADPAEPHAAAADAVPGAARPAAEDPSAADTVEQCRLTTLQLLDLQATAVRLGLYPAP